MAQRLGRRFMFSVVKTVVGRGSGWGLVVWVIPTTWSWTLCTRMRPGSSLRIPIPYLKPCSSPSIQKAKRPGWWLLVQSSPRPWHPYQRSSLRCSEGRGNFFFFFHDFFFLHEFLLWILSATFFFTIFSFHCGLDVL